MVKSDPKLNLTPNLQIFLTWICLIGHNKCCFEEIYSCERCLGQCRSNHGPASMYPTGRVFFIRFRRKYPGLARGVLRRRINGQMGSVPYSLSRIPESAHMTPIDNPGELIGRQRQFLEEVEGASP